MQMDPAQRPSAKELLSHPFMQRSIQLGYIDGLNPPSLALDPSKKCVTFSSVEANEIVHKMLAWYAYFPSVISEFFLHFISQNGSLNTHLH